MKKVLLVLFTATLSSLSFLASAQTQLALTETLDELPTPIVIASTDGASQPGLEKEDRDLSLTSEVEFRYHRNGDPSVKGYFEKPLTDDWAVYLSAFSTRGWNEVTVGPVYYITPEMSVGIGIGSSKYMSATENKKSHHSTLSAFWFLKSENWEAEVLVERYRNDKTNPTYFETYVQRKVTDDLSVGVYVQKDTGWGPRFHYSISKNVSVWASPIVKRWEGSDVKAIVGVSISF